MEEHSPNDTVSNNNSDAAGEVEDFQLDIAIGFLVLLGFCIVCINSTVIYLVVKRERLRTVTNFCLASMALSDMLSGLYVIPLIVACNLAWSNEICLAMDLGQRFLSISTVLHLLLITLERYTTIVHSMIYANSVLKKRSCILILISLWGFSLAASLIQLLWALQDPQEMQLSQAFIIYDVVLLVGIVALPLIIMAVAYGHIFYTLKKHCNQIKREICHISARSMERHRQKERKAVMIYGAMLVVFIIGWFNYFFSSLQHDLGNGQQLPFWADVILMFLRFATSFLNPILYTFLKQDFRHAWKSVKLCPCLEGYHLLPRSTFFRGQSPDKNKSSSSSSVRGSQRSRTASTAV